MLIFLSILYQVDEYIDTFQYEMAQRFCQRALQIEPDNDRVLETSGILLIEVGELEKAKQVFTFYFDVMCVRSGLIMKVIFD